MGLHRIGEADKMAGGGQAVYNGVVFQQNLLKGLESERVGWGELRIRLFWQGVD